MMYSKYLYNPTYVRLLQCETPAFNLIYNIVDS